MRKKSNTTDKEKRWKSRTRTKKKRKGVERKGGGVQYRLRGRLHWGTFCDLS